MWDEPIIMAIEGLWALIIDRKIATLRIDQRAFLLLVLLLIVWQKRKLKAQTWDENSLKHFMFESVCISQSLVCDDLFTTLYY